MEGAEWAWRGVSSALAPNARHDTSPIAAHKPRLSPGSRRVRSESEARNRVRSHVGDIPEAGSGVPEGIQCVIAEDVVRLLLACVGRRDVEDATALPDPVADQAVQNGRDVLHLVVPAPPLLAPDHSP